MAYQYATRGGWKTGWDQQTFYPPAVGKGNNGAMQDYGSANFVVPGDAPPPPPPPPPAAIQPRGTPAIVPRGGAKPAAPIVPITMPKALVAEEVEVGGVGEPREDPHEELKRAIKFLVASQLSKYLSLSRYFDNNHTEFRTCAEHIIEKILEVEKEKGPDSYKSRRMQESVLTFVNAYMEKYMVKKEKLLRELGQSKNKRVAGDQKGSAKKRKRYGKVELHCDPLVRESMLEDNSEQDHDDDDDDDDVVMLKEEGGGARSRAIPPSAPTGTSNSSPIRVREDDDADMDMDNHQVEVLETKGEDMEVMTTPRPVQSPAKQTQTTYSAEPLLFSSQPSRSRSGVKVDYGYDEQEVDGFTESSMSEDVNIVHEISSPVKASKMES